MSLFGLSLPFCVRDILHGVHKVEDIENIITSTCFFSIKEAYDCYKDIYWCDFSEDDVLAVLIAIWPKVVQPRMTNPSYSINIARSHWINASSLNRAREMIEALRY